MPRRTLAAVSFMSAAVLLAVSACSTDDSRASQPVSEKSRPIQSTGPSPDPETDTPSADSTHPSVEQPPELDKTETLVARQSGTHGNRQIEFGGGKKGDALIVAVRCRGKGKINVTVNPAEVTFSLECLDGEVSTTYNQVGVTGVDGKGTVSVEAPSTVRWSLTIGRGEAAAEGLPEPEGV